MKKNIPSPSEGITRDDHEHDDATQRLLDLLHEHPNPNLILNSLRPTRAMTVRPRSPFTVRADIAALDALQHISLLLTCAEQVSDEISVLGSGVERGLIWSMLHSVEMARSLVDALLKGNGPDATP